MHHRSQIASGLSGHSITDTTMNYECEMRMNLPCTNNKILEERKPTLFQSDFYIDFNQVQPSPTNQPLNQPTGHQFFISFHANYKLTKRNLEFPFLYFKRAFRAAQRPPRQSPFQYPTDKSTNSTCRLVPIHFQTNRLVHSLQRIQ